MNKIINLQLINYYLVINLQLINNEFLINLQKLIRFHLSVSNCTLFHLDLNGTLPHNSLIN